jgi:hypothetical protein
MCILQFGMFKFSIMVIFTALFSRQSDNFKKAIKLKKNSRMLS